MTRQKCIDYCEKKPHASSDFPFDETTMTIRVGGKIFALIDTIKEPAAVNLKCDPELSRDLRASYQAITPGYHMNKEHWNTVVLNGDAPEDLLRGLIDRSYDLVAHKTRSGTRKKTGGIDAQKNL